MAELEQLYDLAFNVANDGTVDLEQSAGCGEVARISLHSCQLRLLAERAGLLNGTTQQQEPGARDGVAARRFRAVAGKLFELAGDQAMRSEIFERCGNGDMFMAELDGICALADEFLRDLDTVMPARQQTPEFELPAGGGMTDLECRLLRHLRMLAREAIRVADIFRPAAESDADYTPEEVITGELAAMAKVMLADLSDLLAAYPAGNDEQDLPGYGPVSAEQQAINRAATEAERAQRNDKSDAGISVTPSATQPAGEGEAPRRGRPPTGQAMSNAERQAKHREKQKQADLALGAPA